MADVERTQDARTDPLLEVLTVSIYALGDHLHPWIDASPGLQNQYREVIRQLYELVESDARAASAPIAPQPDATFHSSECVLGDHEACDYEPCVCPCHAAAPIAQPEAEPLAAALRALVDAVKDGADQIALDIALGHGDDALAAFDARTATPQERP